MQAHSIGPTGYYQPQFNNIITNYYSDLLPQDLVIGKIVIPLTKIKTLLEKKIKILKIAYNFKIALLYKILAV